MPNYHPVFLVYTNKVEEIKYYAHYSRNLFCFAVMVVAVNVIVTLALDIRTILEATGKSLCSHLYHHPIYRHTSWKYDYVMGGF
jgi:hypothetical protein